MQSHNDCGFAMHREGRWCSCVRGERGHNHMGPHVQRASAHGHGAGAATNPPSRLWSHWVSSTSTDTHGPRGNATTSIGGATATVVEAPARHTWVIEPTVDQDECFGVEEAPTPPGLETEI
jgi:hypothetical protein